MARQGVLYESVKHAAITLLTQGTAPSVQKVRDVLGTGSNTTLAEHLNRWREEHAQKTLHHLPANLPKELISAFEVLWQTAMEQAQNQFIEYKRTVEQGAETALQKAQEAEKSVADIQHERETLSLVLAQETASKHQLTVELAVANERLIKKEEALSLQKNQYEERQSRLYEEKEGVITKCQQLQDEVKFLQEKIALQAEHHQQAFAQQNKLHEQSENRWVQQIDQAREDAKSTTKKLEHLRVTSEAEIKKLKLTLSDLQHELHEKNTHLKVSLEQTNQLKQEIKRLESEIIKEKSTPVKLEKAHKLKTMMIPGSIKHKNTGKKLKQEINVSLEYKAVLNPYRRKPCHTTKK
jgi:chromosome segregation ATPase